jgi:predicted acylesterase/phospholipase RssA
MLSGGAHFGKFHFGLLKALYEQDLMPRIVSGSSVGSLVLAAVCSKPIDEFEKVSPLLLSFCLTMCLSGVVFGPIIRVQVPNYRQAI